jgi:hypothetical protein
MLITPSAFYHIVTNFSIGSVFRAQVNTKVAQADCTGIDIGGVCTPVDTSKIVLSS